MRVRIASRVYNSANQDSPAKPTSDLDTDKAVASGYDTNIFEQPDFKDGFSGAHGEAGHGMHVDVGGVSGGYDPSPQEQKVLERVAEDLARLGRVKRVGLGVEEKVEFLKVWSRRRR